MEVNLDSENLQKSNLLVDSNTLFYKLFADWSELSSAQRAYSIQIGLSVLAQIADSATTSAGLSIVPTIQELNHITKGIVEMHGFAGLLTFKLVGIGIAVLYMEWRRSINNGGGLSFNTEVLRTVNTLFTIVSLSNLYYVLLFLTQKN